MSNNDSNGTRVDLQKIVDDPYFEYLVAKKTRAQVRLFLTGVGSVILAVLAYGGWEFRSAKNEIEKGKADVQASVAAIRTLTEEIQKNAQDTRAATGAARQSVEQAHALTSTAQTTIASAASAQKEFLSYQTALLQQAATLGQQANQITLEAARHLQELQKHDIPARIAQAQNLTNEAIQARVAADLARKRAEDISGEVDRSLTGLKSLQEVNEELMRTRTSELFLLRERRSYSVTLPDISVRDQARRPQLTFSFRVGGIGKEFTLEYRVQHPGRLIDESDNWIKWRVSAPQPGADEVISRRIEGTPFRIILLQRYYGFFSPEFVVVKILPLDTGDLASR